MLCDALYLSMLDWSTVGNWTCYNECFVTEHDRTRTVYASGEKSHAKASTAV